MNTEDKKRFARYQPCYIEPPLDPELQENEITDKKNILGYIDKINIDKNKLVLDTIINK